MNYIQLDATRVENVAISFHQLWDGALQVLISLLLTFCSILVNSLFCLF